MAEDSIVTEIRKNGWAALSGEFEPAVLSVPWFENLGGQAHPELHFAKRVETREQFDWLAAQPDEEVGFNEGFNKLAGFLTRHRMSYDYSDNLVCLWDELLRDSPKGKAPLPSIIDRVCKDKILGLLAERGIAGPCYYERKIKHDLYLYALWVFYWELEGIPDHGEQIFKIYQAGHIPCGWSGDNDDWKQEGAFLYY